jgi:dipeptidyl aminopeptidase B
MRLSNAGPSDYAGPSSSADMRQKNTEAVNPFIARPAVYYGDGPFDPPSSEDEEEAEGSRHSSEADAEGVLLLNVDKSGPSSPGRAERGDQSPHRTECIEKVRSMVSMVAFWTFIHSGVSLTNLELQKSSAIRILAVVLVSLVALSAFIGIFAGFTYSGTSYHTPGTRKITMDDVFGGKFFPKGAQVNWIAEGMYER